MTNSIVPQKKDPPKEGRAEHFSEGFVKALNDAIIHLPSQRIAKANQPKS